MTFTEFVDRFWQDIAGWVLLAGVAITFVTLLWVLHLKREPMSAIAWSLTVLLMPFMGAFLFYLFGYQIIHRPLRLHDKQRQRNRARSERTRKRRAKDPPVAEVGDNWRVLARLADHAEGFAVTSGNHITFYHSGAPAYDAMIEAIRHAEHQVHMEFFIVQPDESGTRFITELTAAVQRGVKVRFIYDSVGSYALTSRSLTRLREVGGQAVAFLPLLNPLYRLRVNLRNHRKILIVDGRIGFTGGLNIGDEYLGKHPNFGNWRDTHLQLRGPAVESLQRVFLEDWCFAAEEDITGAENFPPCEKPVGDSLVQVVHSGPDSEYKSIRETYFAGILRARKRVWIASPYFVPDPGLKDALVLAGRSGIDVRFLGLFRPDKWIPFLAARYYWSELLDSGVKVYQYANGMMHAKYMLVDGEWASIGTANMDNRSLFLNFEVNCLIYDARAVAELEAQYSKDLELSVQLDPAVYAARPYSARLAENAARLMSPVL